MRLALLVCAAAACAPTPARAPQGDPQQVLPVMSLPLLDGGTWSAQSVRGRVLVIDIWASWCPPCREGLPRIEALAQGRDVAVVSLTIDEDVAAIRRFLADVPLTVPVVHDREQAVTKETLRVQRLPTVLVVDRDGVIRRRLEAPKAADYDALGPLVDDLISGTR